MTLRFAAVAVVSHDGLLRDHNEDSVVVGPWTTCASVTPNPETLVLPLDNPVVVAVADGLGGHPFGDLASTIVVQTLARIGPLLRGEDAVRQALDLCNGRVYEEAGHDVSRTGMGTTVAGVVLVGDVVHVFNVGDSRVYLHGPDGLQRVSVDDSPPLGPGETHTAIVTRTLGGYGRPSPTEPHLSTRPLDERERYLACTDGLTDVVDDAAIARVLDDQSGVAATYELWRAAIAAGGPDNITAALVEVVQAGSDSGPSKLS